MNKKNSEMFKIDSINVETSEPSEADLRKITHQAQLRNRPVEKKLYVVKLNMNNMLDHSTGHGLFKGRSRGHHLFIGGHRIEQYQSFDGGITFLIHDPELLNEFAGHRIRFSEDKNTFIDTGTNFPENPISGNNG